MKNVPPALRTKRPANLEQRVKNNYVWLPVGQLVWRSENVEHLLTELQQEKTQTDLIKSGLTSDREHLSLFIHAFKRMLTRLRRF